MYVTVSYMQSWIGMVIRMLCFGVLIMVLILLRKLFVKAFLFVRDWIASHKYVFAWLRTPAGTRVLLVCGVVLFWFVSKVLFVVLVLLLILSWLRPNWIFRQPKPKQETMLR
jgi:hypothetical protein